MKRRRRNILIGLAVVLVVFFVIFPLRFPHSEAQILQDHLGLTNSSAFPNIRTHFLALSEWTAWIYLEGNASDIQRLLDEQRYVPDSSNQSSETLRQVTFQKAPSPPSPAEARFFCRHDPGIDEQAVVSPGGTQLWLRAARY